MPGTGGTFDQFPLVGEKHLEIALIPGGGVWFPGPFNATGDGVDALAAAETVVPAQALLVQGGPFGGGTHQGGIAGAMGFAEGMAAGDKGYGFFVVHGHAGKGFAHIPAGSDGIRFAIGAFGVDIDQAHLHGGQGALKLTVAAIAIITKPGLFVTPVDVFFRLPKIDTAAPKAKGLEAHGFEGAVPREDDEIGPGNPVAIFLLDGPEQASRLVEVAVVGPTVDRCQSLVAATGPTPTIGGAVGAGTVPGHTDEQAAIMAPVSRPPILGISHQGMQILFQRLEIELIEFISIVKSSPQRIGCRRVLMQKIEVKLIRPPVVV